MYKVLIVDDEVLVRVGLKSTIDWEDLGFTVVAEASNGEQAYEAYLIHKPDVILTDIVMPKQDGFWLTRKIREKNQKAKILILSCHNDFEHVREALKSGADDYILKFEAEDEELIKTMTGIKESLDAEGNGEEDHNYLKRETSTDVTSLKVKLLEDLLDGSMRVDAQLLDRSSDLGFLLEGSTFALISLFRDDGERKADCKDQDWQHMNNAIINLASGIIEQKKMFCLAQENNNRFLFLLSKTQIKKVEVQEVIELIRSSVAQYFDIPISAVISRSFNDIKEVSDVYRDVALKAEQLFYIDESCMINAAEQTLQNINIFSVKKSYEQSLINSINEESQQKALEVIEQTEAFFRKNTVKDVEVKLFYSNMISNVFERYYHCFVEEDKAKDYTYYHNRLMAATKIKSVVALMKEIIITIINNVKTYRNNNSNDIIKEAIDYIERNYQKKISLQSLAEYLNLSKHYVCYLFKKETGENISLYVNKLRIEKAKQLVVDSDCKIKEIYDDLGFSDQQYFSKTFKKITGMTIMQYKDSVLNNSETNR
ncbi:transcriptional regulator AraC family [Clostridium aceticum]|uniref:Stage 0 sporulation protein A homolog n=1 Tax=Clostridium aceticum TaxID=84022 RepID=A0A0D8IAR4_9CLOT|nr:response regulator [Clostridium aceticum]AKL95919.1 transcriptional regulator AraC family [Clostridium aceticum]KJF27127.1 hypothetical protein TZ02_10055 [Clostridium aceticum]